LCLKALEGIAIRILCAKHIRPDIAETLSQIGCEARHLAADLMTYGVFIDPDELDGLAVLIELLRGKPRGGNYLGNNAAQAFWRR
jgi:hypothetical protein